MKSSKMADEKQADNVEVEDESSSSDDDAADEVDSKIQKLILEAEVNPYQYDKHVELITALRQSGDLDKLRTARENMASVYPLSETLWIEWLQDESPLASLPEHKEYLINQFEAAIQDYASVKIWHEYCQYVMNNIDSPADIERARTVFERAITSVGLHVAEGSSIWDGYREFELAILDSYQQLKDCETIGMDAKVESQLERIYSIYRRQLSIPLLGMADTLALFQDWSTEAIPNEIHRSCEKASQKLALCMQYEEKLHELVSESSYEAYSEYIKFEMKDGDPARIQCVFERALKDNCLVHGLWERYVDYLDYKLKLPDISLAAHKRSVRNCPWVSALWVRYLKALERKQADYTQIKDVFNESLKGGFPDATSYLELWLANCDYHRRRIVDWSFEEEKVEELHKTFENAVTYMNHYFGLEGDKDCVLLREWATIEVKYLQNIKRAQELWDTTMKKHVRDLNMWFEYTHFLMVYSDNQAVRKVFQRAIQISFDDPLPIFQAFIKFERLNGSLSDLDDAQQKVTVLMNKMKDRKTREELLHKQPKLSKAGRSDNKASKKKKLKKEKDSLKRSNEMDTGFTPKKKKSDTSHKQQFVPAESDPVVAMDTTPVVMKPNKRESSVVVQTTGSTTESEGGSTTAEKRVVDSKEDPDAGDCEKVSKVDNDLSVFLSNLLFTVNEDLIHEKFEKCGDIDTVRIVKNRMGKSKGFAYLQFKTKEAVELSLLLDRENLLGRPMFVSRCVDKSLKPTQFKFPTNLDKRTLYVTNLSFETPSNEVEEYFSKVGKLKQVRLVTNRSGKSKGFAYVEYENESDAQSALVKLDQQLFHGRPLNVALSNPPVRKTAHAHEDKSKTNVSRSKETPFARRSKTQLSMLPRSVQQSSDDDRMDVMSNSDFRRFLQK